MSKKNEDPTKSYQQWTAENTEPNNTPVQPHDNNYQAVGAGSTQNAQTEQMKPEDQAMLKAAGEAWTNASTQEERDAAHAWAESIRNKYGYSGGQDGSDRLDVVTGNKLDDSINNDSVNNGVKPSYANDYANNGAADKYGVGNNYAKEVVDGMTPTDYNKLTKYGEDYNMYAAQMEQALAKAGTEEEKAQVREIYQPYLDFCHQNAEAIRNKYGYSGGTDGSEYIPTGSGSLGGGSTGGTQTQPTVTLPEATVVPESAGLPESTKIPDSPDLSGLKELPDATTIPDAPDFTSLLDQWLSNAQKQQQAQIDYATREGITELERAEQDAQEQFQTQRDQVSADEAKALDNQALYAQRRGDKGGIGAVQYATIQNTAMQQRRTINQAQTRLATDTARQMADLRSQGEFEKADALLELTKTYLSKLMEVQQWNAEYNIQKAQLEESIRQWEAGYQLDVTQFEENIRQWQASFQESVRQWEADYLESIRQWEAGFAENVRQWNADYALEVEKFYESKRQWEAEFAEGKRQWDSEFGLSEGSLTGNYKGNATLESQKLNNSTLAEAGWTVLQYGILPSTSQLAAMGISSAQAQEYLTALKLSQSVSGSGNSSGGKPKDDQEEKEPDVKIKPLEWLAYHNVPADQAESVLHKQGYGDYAYDLAEQYKEQIEQAQAELERKETAEYGTMYSTALGFAKTMKSNGWDAVLQMLSIYKDSQLTKEGVAKIREALYG